MNNKDEQIKAEGVAKRSEWLKKNGFDENGDTYVLIGLDSYSIKNELKEAGWKYNKILRWHSPSPTGYEENIYKVNWTEVYTSSIWGEMYPIQGSQQKIDSIIKAAMPASTSEWIGEKGDKISNLLVTLVSIHGFQGKYGFSQVVKFKTEEENVLTWFTTVNIKIAEGDNCILCGTIKNLDTYNNEKITVMTRCKLSEVEK